MTQKYTKIVDTPLLGCLGCGSAVMNMAVHDHAHEKWEHPIHVIGASPQIAVERIGDVSPDSLPPVTSAEHSEVVRRLRALVDAGILNTPAAKTFTLIADDFERNESYNNLGFADAIVRTLYPNGVK